MTIQECLGKNIKYYRNLKKLTQSQLAEKSNTSTNYIATIETGKKYPSPSTLEKIAKALNINAIDLFQIENKNTTSKREFEFKKIKKELNIQIKNLIDTILK